MTMQCLMLLLVESLVCPLPPVDPMTPLTVPQFEVVLEGAGWPESLWAEATAVGYCESNLIPGARNGVSLGLYQINFFYDSGGSREIFNGWARWIRKTHGKMGDPYNPVYNAWVARMIYEHNNGWDHNWPNCH